MTRYTATALFTLVLIGGCASQAPTIAHVHIGHALTAMSGTPGDQGYFIVAEGQAAAAHSLALSAAEPGKSADAVQRDIDELNQIVNLKDKLSLNAAIKEAARHIEFAANMNDASQNVQSDGPKFVKNSESILYRNQLIKLYSDDAMLTRSQDELRGLVSEIKRLTNANLNGDDVDGNGVIGNVDNEYGLRQLRNDLDRMIENEDPPYRTVDRWYLFNLIRLPSGDWIFSRGASGASRGY